MSGAQHLKRGLIASFVALCLSLTAGKARADVLLSFEETGGNVVGTLSGFLDLTGATKVVEISIGISGISPIQSAVLMNVGLVDTYAIAGPSNFGLGGLTLASSVTGDTFGIVGDINDIVDVPDGYQSTDPLSGTITFNSATFVSLGITPGDYVYSLLTGEEGQPTGETITLRFGPSLVSEVPLAGALPLFATGLGALGLLGWRRKWKQVAA